MRAIGAALTARGVAPERIATEAFGAVADPRLGDRQGRRPPRRTRPTAPPGAGPAVTFVRSNLPVAWDDRYPSLLDLAEACDVPAGFGCRTRRLPQLRERPPRPGRSTYEIEPLEPPAAGRVLLCCTRPASALTLDL